MSEIAAVVFKRQVGAEVAATTVANANVPDKVDKVILKASAKKLMISFASSKKVGNKTASITKGGHLLKAFVKTEGTCSDQSVGGTFVVDGEKSATCEVGGSDSSGTQFETSSTTTKQKLKKQNVLLRMDYVCDDCNQCFATNSELKKHKRSHKKLENRCDVCNISFADDFERMRHKQTHRDRIPCPECDKSFTLERSLRDHVATYHSNVEVEKPFECDICGHRFVRANLAAIHRRTHTGERPFQCEQCGRGFICRGDLNKHTRLHVYGYIYKCSVCGKELKTSRESADHKRMHSSGINCPICGKSFTRYQNMQAHVRGTHDGERRFQCDLCPKAFVYAQNLRCHKRQHQPDQSLTCNVCDETLTSPGDLLQHTAQHRDLPKPDMDLELSAGSDPVNLDTDSSSSDVRQPASSDL